MYSNTRSLVDDGGCQTANTCTVVLLFIVVFLILYDASELTRSELTLYLLFLHGATILGW